MVSRPYTCGDSGFESAAPYILEFLSSHPGRWRWARVDIGGCEAPTTNNVTDEGGGALSGPRRSPPALGAPWGHAPPVWCHTGAHNTPDWTHDSAAGWRRSWRLEVCGSAPSTLALSFEL